MYYDEHNLGKNDMFKGGRPGGKWFDGSHKGQTCEQRATWWAGTAWHKGLKNNLDPYPGSVVKSKGKNAFAITIMPNTKSNL